MTMEIRLTQEELFAEIVEMTGWICCVCKKSGKAHFGHQDPPEHIKNLDASKLWEGKHFWPCMDIEVREFEHPGNPTQEIHHAEKLLLGLNSQKPHQSGHYPVIIGCGVHGWRFDLMFQPESDAPALEFSVTGKTLELAICLAWYQFKTGYQVMLMDSDGWVTTDDNSEPDLDFEGAAGLYCTE